MKKKHFSAQLFIVTSLFVPFAFTSSLSCTTKSRISSRESSREIEENQYKIAKVDPLFEVTTVRKTGSDKNRINLIYLGDGYVESDSKDKLSNFLYNNVIIPWLSTTPKFKASSISGENVNDIGVLNPWQTWMNDKINVYSIQPTSKTNTLNKDNFYGMYDTNLTWVTDQGISKAYLSVWDIYNNFLEEDALINNKFINLVHSSPNNYRVEASPFPKLTEGSGDYHTHIHEMGHSIFSLGDEYQPSATIAAPNVSTTTNVKWKEFLNFRGVEINSNAGGYIPSESCIMLSVHDKTYDYCEVCNYELQKTVAEYLQQPLFYIGDPQLTKKRDYSYDSYYYSTQNLLQNEIYDFNINWVKNSQLELRTVVSNLTNSTRKIKLRIRIQKKDGTYIINEQSNEEIIKPKDIKQLVLYSSTINETNLQDLSVIGEVIDAETNEILATSLDRQNRILKYNNKWANTGKELHTIKINFVDKDSKQPLPNVKPTIITQRDGTEYQLQKILFNGYRFDSWSINNSSSSINNSTVKINGKDIELTYYYKKLPAKTLPLKLIDKSSGKVIIEKKATVYENQTFIPKSSDFFLYDLNNFSSVTNSSYYYDWNLSAVPMSDGISYDQITSNSEIIYALESNPSSHIKAIDRVIEQGDIKSKNDLINNKFLWSTDYKYSQNNNSGSYQIIYNDIKYNEVGEYTVIFKISNFIQEFQIYTNEYQRINVRVVERKNTKEQLPSDLDAEIGRLNTISTFWIPEMENSRNVSYDYASKLNKDNILGKIQNLSLNLNKFTYEVVDYNFTQSGSNSSISFKIEVGYNGQKKRTEELIKLFTLVNTDVTEADLSDEYLRIMGMNLNYLRSDIKVEQTKFINEKNIFLFLKNWVPYKKFEYEIYSYSREVDKIKFQIKISLNGKSRITRQFELNVKSDQLSPEEVEMQNEINRINSLSLSLKNPILTQQEVNNINQSNILKNVNEWVETPGFAYEIINFNNSNNQFKFNIKVSKANVIKTSNLFTLSYQIKSEQTEQDLLQQEINRINNLPLHLANNSFSQQEIDQINDSNFADNLSNWNLVTSNSSKYNYEITSFGKANNKFTFNIKVTLISNPSISQVSKQFSLDYQISININQALKEEKNRIDNLSLNKQKFSQEEINGILNDPSSFTQYLNDWSNNDNKFDYQFIVNSLSQNQLSLIIQIKDRNTNEYQSSNPFVLNYESSDISNNNNSGSSNNLTTVILASTLAPAGAIAAGAAGTIIYKKKKRKY